MKTSTKNSKLVWKIINDIVNLKGNKSKEIKCVKGSNGNEITDPSEISDAFNSFFVNVGKSLSEKFSSSNISLSFHTQISESMYLKPLTVYEIDIQICNLDSSKSVRPMISLLNL